MGIGSNAVGVAQQAERVASAMLNSVKPKTWKAASEAAKATQEAVVHAQPGMVAKAGSAIGWLVAAPFKLAFKAGSALVSAPISFLVLKPMKAILGGVAGFYERSPRVASVLTGGAAIAGVSSWMSHRNSMNLQANFEASQVAAAQAMSAQQGAFTNSASQADVDAAKAIGGTVGPHTAAVAEAAKQQQQIAQGV